MLCLLSPAKSLDFETSVTTPRVILPRCLRLSAELIDTLKQKSTEEIGRLMNLSEKLRLLNHERYRHWSIDDHETRGKPCALAFNGDVYAGLRMGTLSEADREYAHNHALRILSGLYGILRPLDLILPHRLEMGTSLQHKTTKNLYEFWERRIGELLNEDLQRSGATYLINLASREYFTAVPAKHITTPIIYPIFKDKKNGTYKIISFFAKKARGMMARYIIENRVTSLSRLYEFNAGGYYFDSHGSQNGFPVFLREEQKASVVA